MDKAAAAVSSYELLRSDDEDMKHNRKFYIDDAGADPAWFKPRPEAAMYSSRRVREKALLDFVDEKFDLDREDREALNIVVEAFDPEVGGSFLTTYYT
jgi:hypothetical protein